MILGERRGDVLRIIIEGYIVRAAPVASKAIADRYGLKVSPATIRNDTAYLEQEGYITHPHHSAGSIPTDKAYRHYVELMSSRVDTASMEQEFIEQLFDETRDELEQWLKLAAELLARFVHNMVVITPPKSTQCRLKYLDLVSLQDFMVLLVLVLREAKLRRQVLVFDKKLNQDELTKLANRLTSIYAGMGSDEILASRTGLSAEETQITECLADIIATEDRLEYGEPCFEGLRLMLSQPEFATGRRILNILEVLEGEEWLRNMFYSELSKGEVRAIIGEENQEPALRGLSLLVSRYGIPDKASGIIGVIGPKRMDYVKAISSLSYLSTLLSTSVAEYI